MGGMMQIFDMRRPTPLLRKDHGYGFPVKKLIHMTTSSQEKKVLSSDKRIIKIWDEADGEPWTSVEPVVDINDVAWCRDSGMILTRVRGEAPAPTHSERCKYFAFPWRLNFTISRSRKRRVRTRIIKEMYRMDQPPPRAHRHSLRPVRHAVEPSKTSHLRPLLSMIVLVLPPC